MLQFVSSGWPFYWHVIIYILFDSESPKEQNDTRILVLQATTTKLCVILSRNVYRNVFFVSLCLPDDDCFYRSCLTM